MTYYSPRMGSNPFPNLTSTSDSSIGSSRITFSTSTSHSSNQDSNSSSSSSDSNPSIPILTSPQLFNPAICYNLSQFKGILKQSRRLDDNLIRSLNRTQAQSRDRGQFGSPSLLDPKLKSSSSNVNDLGISSYSTTPEKVCLEFWKQLMQVWLERERMVGYCKELIDGNGNGNGNEKIKIGRNDVEWGLDADLNQDTSRRNVFGGVQKGSRNSRDNWDDRGSRLEGKDEMMKRQINQESNIERVIRQSSLAAFKSRCSLFQPEFQVSSTASRQERAETEWQREVWEGTR